MNINDWIGTIGVSLLLLAYILNLKDLIHKESISYLCLNTLGAGLACIASVLLNYVPFIILEATWTIVSLYGFFNYFNKI
ncbi:MAG: hypothetical protein ABI851_04065 [Saprospiraceae bacterium]